MIQSGSSIKTAVSQRNFGTGYALGYLFVRQRELHMANPDFEQRAATLRRIAASLDCIEVAALLCEYADEMSRKADRAAPSRARRRGIRYPTLRSVPARLATATPHRAAQISTARKTTPKSTHRGKSDCGSRHLS